MDRAAQLLTQFRAQISEAVANNSQCVIAVPSMLQGGIIIGGQSGKGYAACKTSAGWSAPAPISMSGGTFGAQVGFQSSDVLAVVMNATGQNALLSGNFKVGVDASAAAGPVGTGRGTGTNVSSKADTLTYSSAKGLFAGAELNGTTISADDDAARALYGSPVQLSAVLGGRIAPPKDGAVDRYLSALRAGFGPGRTVVSRNDDE
jgi:lipid-binding SYLF domain-containing protein